jgi:hypothetical protein
MICKSFISKLTELNYNNKNHFKKHIKHSLQEPHMTELPQARACLNITNCRENKFQLGLGLLRGWIIPALNEINLVHTLENKLILWSRVLHEKLMVVKKLPAFRRTQRFITMLKTDHHCSIS